MGDVRMGDLFVPETAEAIGGVVGSFKKKYPWLSVNLQRERVSEFEGKPDWWYADKKKALDEIEKAKEDATGQMRELNRANKSMDTPPEVREFNMEQIDELNELLDVLLEERGNVLGGRQ